MTCRKRAEIFLQNTSTSARSYRKDAARSNSTTTSRDSGADVQQRRRMEFVATTCDAFSPSCEFASRHATDNIAVTAGAAENREGFGLAPSRRTRMPAQSTLSLEAICVIKLFCQPLHRVEINSLKPPRL